LQAKSDSSPGALLRAMNEAGFFGLERTIARQTVELATSSVSSNKNSRTIFSPRS
jgi:hypothetical protein